MHACRERCVGSGAGGGSWDQAPADLRRRRRREV